METEEHRELRMRLVRVFVVDSDIGQHFEYFFDPITDHWYEELGFSEEYELVEYENLMNFARKREKYFTIKWVFLDWWYKK